MAKGLLSAGTSRPEPGNHDGKGSLKHRNHLARKPVDRNPGNHDSKGNLERRNRYTGTEIMTAKGIFSAGTSRPEPRKS